MVDVYSRSIKDMLHAAAIFLVQHSAPKNGLVVSFLLGDFGFILFCDNLR